MAEKSLFFNALANPSYPTGYDRNYNADDLSDWLAVVWENGVVKNGLQVVATSGMTIQVSTGRAAIKGKAFVNTSAKNLVVGTAPTGTQARYDMIVLKYDNSIGTRDIHIELRTGQTFATTPTDAQFLSQMTRNETIYELLLGYVRVDPSITTIAQGNIVDCRANTTLCGWFTAVKGYDEYYDAIVQKYEYNYTIPTTTNVVTTNLAASLYNNNYSIITVFTNGIKEQENAYVINTSGNYVVINFTTNRNSGAKINVVLSNFIDGEGLSTAINSYNEWVNDVEQLKEKTEFTYVCNGVNDNVMITNIVNSFLSLTDNYRSLNLSVIGNFGYTAMAGGSGTFSNPYVLFNFAETATDKKVNIDFSNCSLIDVSITNGTTNVFFKAYQLNITGLRINANNTAGSTIIRAFNSDTIALECNKCYFWLTAYQDSYISRTGTFNDCYGKVYNTINYSWCFSMTGNGFLNIKGGEYRAYVLDNSTYSAVVGQSGANSITIMYGVSAPTEAQGSYRQTHSIYHSAGQLGSTYLISELTVYSIDSSKIWASISKSRGNIL